MRVDGIENPTVSGQTTDTRMHGAGFKPSIFSQQSYSVHNA